MLNETNSQVPHSSAGLKDKPLSTSNTHDKPDLKEESCPFTEKFNILVSKIKKATDEELPDLKKSLTELLESKSSSSQDGLIAKGIETLASCAKDEISQARHAGKDYISNNPWQAIALAGLAGFFIANTVCRR